MMNALSLFLFLIFALLWAAPCRGGETHLLTWTSRADFENNELAVPGETTRINVDTVSNPGSLQIAQVRSAGRLLGENRRVGSGFSLGQGHDVAANTVTGEYLLLWGDSSAEGQTVYALRLGPEGEPRGEASAVSRGKYPMGFPSAAFNARDNQYLVVWAAGRPEGKLFARLIDAGGSPAGEEIRVGRGSASKSRPHVAWNEETGGYLVVWQDGRNGSGDIYGQSFDGRGRPAAEEQAICTAEGAQGRPRLEYIPGENAYALVWEDFRRGNDDVYFRKIAADGTPAGPEIAAGSNEWHERIPSVAYNVKSGQFLLAWNDYREVDEEGKSLGMASIFQELFSLPRGIDIYSVILEKDGSPVGEPFALCDAPYTQTGPRVVFFEPTGQYIAVWQDGRRRYENWDIYGRVLDGAGRPASEEIPVSTMPDEQFTPSAAFQPSSRKVMVLLESVGSGKYGKLFFSQLLDSGGPVYGTVRGLRVDTGKIFPVWGGAYWNAELPPDTAVAFRTRSAPLAEKLKDSPWAPYATEVGSAISSPSSRWLEIEIRLESRDQKRSPLLHNFTVRYE